jgi:two-component system, chemotaxis family, response regulator Rcp1
LPVVIQQIAWYVARPCINQISPFYVESSEKRRCHLQSVCDGQEALTFLRRQGKHAQAVIPDLVLLDLNLPREDGRHVLAEVKGDSELSKIPVVIFTTSHADSDVRSSYELGANSYVRKPGTLGEFVATVRCVAEYWFGHAVLPLKENS